ncbi:hypothetical protein IFR05_011818 [Cadophora sp. M221]|nr:hypothetical protein IFR05_011818 [Cadophora sp. M221]
MENAEGRFLDLELGLAENQVSHRCLQCPHPTTGVNGLGSSSPFPLLSLQPGFENCPSASVLRFGNLESEPNVSVDARASFGYGFGGDHDSTSFPYSDFLDLDFEFSNSAASGEVTTVTPDSHQTLPFINSSSPNSDPPSVYPSTASIADSPGPVVTEGPPPSAIRQAITPSVPFECQVCHQTYGFESRFKSHMETHNAIICTFEGCTESFKLPKDRTRHIDSCHLQQKWPCKLYGQSLSRKDKLAAHMKKCISKPKKRKRPVSDE